MAYQRIVFAQGEDAVEALNILDNEGEGAVIDYLLQWDEKNGEITESPSSGQSDYVIEQDDLRLTYNLRFGYIGLERILKESETMMRSNP